MNLRRDTFPSPQSTATAASRRSERLVFLAFQCHHWDLPGPLPLVIGELRIQVRLFGIEPVSLFTAERRGSGLVGFAPDLDGDFRVGQHDLKLAWWCWSHTSSPQATGSASILRKGNIWNEFKGLCFNTTRRREKGQGNLIEKLPRGSKGEMLTPIFVIFRDAKR
jgi:hypothetical protein